MAIRITTKTSAAKMHPNGTVAYTLDNGSTIFVSNVSTYRPTKAKVSESTEEIARLMSERSAVSL